VKLQGGSVDAIHDVGQGQQGFRSRRMPDDRLIAAMTKYNEEMAAPLAVAD
jgi:hypothetical protein